MADPRFFQAAGPFTAGELALRTGAEIGGAGNAELLLTGVAAIEAAGAQEVSFLANARYVDAFAASAAGAAFVHPGVAAKAPPGMTLLISTAPYRAFALAVQAFFPRPRPVPGIAPTAVIEDGVELGGGVAVAAHVVIESGASIGTGSTIGANSVIGRGVVIGADCIIGANVTISHAIIGDRVTVYPGVRIGQDGFGFAPDISGHVKIPQLGRVLIGDDVEIGANTTIDRGAGPDTVIGAGCMIDNLVQIAHNVTLGRGTILVAQSGVAGSAKLGNFVSVGGQTAIVGHLTVGDGARIAGKSGVTRDVPAGASMGGIPAVSLLQWHRQTVALERLTRRKDK